jgi:hypothetical protein
MRYISLDADTAEVAVHDERPQEGIVWEGLRPRSHYVEETGNISRDATPTEYQFYALIGWTRSRPREPLDDEHRRGYGGNGGIDWQPWTEVIIRQAVRLIQLHGADLINYFAQHGPD